jgi:hypothetical protein
MTHPGADRISRQEKEGSKGSDHRAVEPGLTSKTKPVSVFGGHRGYRLAFAIQRLVLLAGAAFPRGPHPNWDGTIAPVGQTTNFSG